MNTVLKDAVLEGKFPPSEYAYLYNYMVQNHWSKDKTIDTSAIKKFAMPSSFFIDDEIYFEYYPNEKEIDSFRVEVYLPTLEDVRKKLQYYAKNKASQLLIRALSK